MKFYYTHYTLEKGTKLGQWRLLKDTEEFLLCARLNYFSEVYFNEEFNSEATEHDKNHALMEESEGDVLPPTYEERMKCH